MTAPAAFQYAILRLVPSIERGEHINVGVALFCRQARFLEVATALDERRLALFAPDLPASEVRPHLDALAAVAAGDAAGGAVAAMDRSERFHWLVAPSSTIVQASPVHTGLTRDPAATLQRLLERLVRA